MFDWIKSTYESGIEPLGSISNVVRIMVAGLHVKQTIWVGVPVQADIFIFKY